MLQSVGFSKILCNAGFSRRKGERVEPMTIVQTAEAQPLGPTAQPQKCNSWTSLFKSAKVQFVRLFGKIRWPVFQMYFCTSDVTLCPNLKNSTRKICFSARSKSCWSQSFVKSWISGCLKKLLTYFSPSSWFPVCRTQTGEFSSQWSSVR